MPGSAPPPGAASAARLNAAGAPRDRSTVASSAEAGGLMEIRLVTPDSVSRHKIDDLPDAFRIVFVLREVEEMTMEDVARCLGIPEATVRTRLFRAKARLRESIASEIDVAAQDVFAFAGSRCDRIVHTVLARIADLPVVPNESTPFLKE